MNTGIKHLVVFTLKNNDQNAAEDFLESSRRILAQIPGVNNFEVLRQVSLKNNYKFGFCMLFANNDFYKAYNEHPDHVAYIHNYWLKYVEDFLEIDTIVLE